MVSGVLCELETHSLVPTTPPEAWVPTGEQVRRNQSVLLQIYTLNIILTCSFREAVYIPIVFCIHLCWGGGGYGSYTQIQIQQQ